MHVEIVGISATPRQYFITGEHLAKLAGAKGYRVQCLSGCAWITAYDHVQDVQLGPGEVFEVPNNGLILIGATGHCRFQVKQGG